MTTRITLFTPVGNLSLDCTQELTHNLPITVTKHPIEDGSNISDHIVNENMTFSLTGIIVDQKIQSFENGMDRQQAFNFLEGLRSKRLLISLLTYNKKYNNLVISNISFPKSAAEDVLNVQMDLEQVRIVSSTFTSVPVSLSPDKATDGKDVGPQQGTSASQDEVNGILSKGRDYQREIDEATSNASAALSKGEITTYNTEIARRSQIADELELDIQATKSKNPKISRNN